MGVLRHLVRDVYAASEFLGIAFDGGYDWLQVNANWVILEPVDESYLPVPAGKAWRTVLLTADKPGIACIRLSDTSWVTASRFVLIPAPEAAPLPAIRIGGRRDEILFLQEPRREKNSGGCRWQLPP